VQNLYFKNPQHKQAMAVLANLAGTVGTSDIEYKSALYLLAAVGGKDIQKYVDQNCIKFGLLLQDMEPWSSSEKALIRLAATCFNGSEWSIAVHEVFRNLDKDNCRVALTALGIRYL
jgi:hypothetical protein